MILFIDKHIDINNNYNNTNGNKNDIYLIKRKHVRVCMYLS